MSEWYESQIPDDSLLFPYACVRGYLSNKRYAFVASLVACKVSFGKQIAGNDRLRFLVKNNAEMVKIYIDPEIAALRRLHSNLSGRGYLNLKIGELMALQARTILDGHKAGNSAVTFQLGSWSPDFVGKGPVQIMSCSLTLEQAQETIAREYGYGGWSEIESLKNTMLDEEFERAVDAVVEGDTIQIQRLVEAKPELVIQRSQYGHRATLLHYIGANGVESYRQITPLNAPDVARCLILAGADVNAIAEIYGGSTALNLVLTSAHPHNAGVTRKIADVLREAGAN